MRYVKFRSDDPGNRPCSLCLVAVLLGIPLAVLVLLLTYNAWKPNVIATGHLNDLNTTISLIHYKPMFDGYGQYVWVQRQDKTLKSAVENFDWAHYPRLSIYRLPEDNIGVIGPYGSSGIVFDFHTITTRDAKSAEADNWTYLGAFDSENGVVGPIRFLTPGESAECLETNMEVHPSLSRLSVRKPRCSGR